MAEKKKQIGEMEWPRWASWAVLGVAATALLTLAATINDIY